MKVLVCTDGSEQGYKAAAVAAKLVGSMEDAEVTVLYVYSIGSVPIEVHKRMVDWLTDEGEKIVAKAASAFSGESINVKTMLKEGRPARTIIEEAAEGKYDLVVIGNKGAGGFREFFLGGVSSIVSQEVKTNVLIVK